MPATDTIIVQGKCKWAHVKRPNKFGDWSIDLYPNATSLKVIEGLIAEGIKNRLKKDDDGYYIRFKRPTTKQTRTGRMITYDAPQVMDKDRRVIEDDLIGNGSDVSILLEVYGGSAPTGGTYKAARLKGVKVENLIPYTVDSVDNRTSSYDAKRLSDLDEAPLQQETW